MTKGLPDVKVTRFVNHLRHSAPWLFMRQMFKAPAEVGAIWPSSASLARHIAEHIPLEGDGLVIELGAGTGAVTRAILEHGIAPERLVVIERSAEFVAHLRRYFPNITVLLGDAAELGHLIPKEPCIKAIVSSLPLRSLPPATVHAIIAQWSALMCDGGIVIQFTYNLRPPLALDGWTPIRDDLVWANLPPARIGVFQRQPDH